MPVNIEIKGNLARLLATENLIVEHKQVETAQFNTETRVLILPIWDSVSNYVYDMLVAHEVGHALFTPYTMWKEGKYESLPHSYVNIVEDARIERLMKNKFAGLNRDFFKGYEELNGNDFFELEGKNINAMKFIDKINLYFKLGAFLRLEFNDTENEFITEISKAETFDEVLDISQRVYEYSKEQQEKRQQEQQSQPTSTDGQGEDAADLDTPSYERDYESESDDEIDAELDLDDPETEDGGDGDEQEKGAGNEAGDWNNIDDSDTQQAFDKNSEDLQNRNAIESEYVSIPKLNLDNVVIPFEVVYKELKEHFTAEAINESPENDTPRYYYRGAGVAATIQEYRDYKKSASKDVNNLVKEFEMKKSADNYARQGISKTGVLDTSKLHTYMYNEDIFKKVITVPDGKNHGLVFLLDWSGSMQTILKDTMKQLFNLVWFCRKVNIPFEVYAFSNDAWALGTDNTPDSYYSASDAREKLLVHELVEGEVHIEGLFRMVNILSSTKRSKDIDDMMLQLYLQVNGFAGAYYSYCRKFTLSGTPLNEALISVGQLTKQLIKTAKLQKCHVITLTDGEGYHLSYNKMRERYYGTGKEMGASGIVPSRTVIRHNGRTFTGGYSETDFTCKLVEAVKSDIPNCNFIGIRLLEKGGLSRFYHYYGRTAFEDIDEAKRLMRKNGLISFKTLSFDMWFAMNGNSIHADDELEVDQGAEKRKITAAFRKMNRNKKTNKFMVKEFINQIA